MLARVAEPKHNCACPDGFGPNGLCKERKVIRRKILESG
jgi:hypothetical protein